MERVQVVDIEEDNKKKPVKTWKVGSIFLNVWENEITTPKGEITVYNFTFVKRYKDKNDEWQTTESYRLNDLQKVALLSKTGYEWVMLMERD